MAKSLPLAQRKTKISAKLLDEAGISGVGLRANAVVVYLASDDATVRRRAEQLARQVAPGTPLLFEVSGSFEKRSRRLR